MKIIGGQAKGRVLRTPRNNPLVRPILARIKKSLFDILRPRMGGARFLDLYAGTGAVGIEALSQGAKSAAFVEQDSACARLIHENLEQLGLTDQAVVYRLNVTGDLNVLPVPHDIIFMGPPYKDAAKNPLALVHPTLENIGKYKLLADQGLIVAQHHKKEIVASTSEWEMKRQETYGDSLLSFFVKSC